ncbi:hypothetical protein QTH87_11365 [Variovorax sp. J22P168]|uniref:hypothetical protein n=1 Tax=Variovorax jilinensis TaxID=3053513 RepID=UPI0025755AFC|nr:hypothetical protein [Variovorax sp. J22P168]MDM0013031.1 hypothetical protein [Variovorax sp. J22P168]
MNTSTSIAALCAACVFGAGCDSQPAVAYVAHGADFSVLGLTEEAAGCEPPARLGYLTGWDGKTVRGCWVRDRAEIRLRFDGGLDDRRIPVGDFHRTEIAQYRRSALD